MDIFTADLDGKNLKRLTDTPGYDAEGSYSADGSQIVFTSFRDGDGEIYIMDADGKNPRRITHAKGYDGGPFFSPDGKRIIYRSDRKGNDLLQIYVNNTEGTAERALTSNEFVNWGPYWHPDGRHIIYATSKHGHSNYELYLMDVDSGSEERITYHDGFDGLPVFSPTASGSCGPRAVEPPTARASSSSPILPSSQPLRPPRRRRAKERLNWVRTKPHQTENVTTMGPKDVIAKTLDASDFILKRYLGDLSDADLKIRPIEGMNPIALQLGHLIVAERMFAEMVEPGSAPPLPAGFAEAHDFKNKSTDDSRFLTKDAYLKLYEAQRAHLKSVLAGVTDAELGDNRGGKLPAWAPTVADCFNMAGVHSLNHSGQFVAVRRYLKKPIAF